jgi:hypothetical protein
VIAEMVVPGGCMHPPAGRRMRRPGGRHMCRPLLKLGVRITDAQWVAPALLTRMRR